MSINQGSNVSTSYEGAGYAYDKVVFQAGKPLLDGELNLAQELQEVLTQRSTARLPSGWLSYRPFYTSRDLDNCFYSQDPTGAKPEVALVNGWTVYVTNTNTPLRHVNKIQFADAELRSGSRVDGVFLEVWRSVIEPQLESGSTTSDEEISKPQPVTKIADLRSVWMYNENIGWAVGDKGTILKTVDSGINWVSKDTPINIDFRSVKFYDLNTGYAVGARGNIIKTINGGESWFTLETPTGDDLYDLAIIDENKICIVGDNGTMLLSSDGTIFNIVSQTAGNTEDLRSVYFFDIAVGWSVGSNGTLLMTKDGGQIWQKYNVIDSATSTKVTNNFTSVAFYNLNDGVIVGEEGKIYRTSDSGFTWANMSDRIWYNGAYKSISEIFPTKSVTFNKVFLKKQFSIKFTIAVYPDSRNYFKNLVYKISPSTYPNSLVLEFTGVQDNLNYVHALDLDSYATSEELMDAINEIVNPYKLEDAALDDADREKVRVFQASIDYEPFAIPTDFRPTAGSFSSTTPAELTFSVEDRAWIAGNSGIALISTNSGSKWEVMDLGGIGYDLLSLDFVDDTIGWYCGTDGSIVKYDGTTVTTIDTQSTDLITKVSGRIFPEGNILSQAEEFLPENIIDPQVGVETTKRVQIQYRIRIVDGIDPYVHPEAGLGHSFVYSLGPNSSVELAGAYTYENMGAENGDYGLWRARCRSTYDGYCWAVPMFMVTRRNSGGFDVNNNINGSTYFDLGAVRPDGLFYEDITDQDVVDIRRSININSYSYLLEKNLEKLLSNTLGTNVSDKDQKGLQYGRSIMMVDQFTGTTEITNLLAGDVSSSATLEEDTRTFDPNIQITESELTFGPIDNGLYHNDPAYYSAYVQRDGVLTNEPVDGTWEGYGTDTVIFHIAENFTPAGGDLEGVEYVITATYIDHSHEGLSKVPQHPVCVKYHADPTDASTTYYFRGINSRINSEVLEILPEVVEGHPDYTTLYSAINVPDNQDDQDLYEIFARTGESDSDHQRSLRKYRGQQYRGSLVVYHHFMTVSNPTNIIRVPKNINDYFVMNVKQVKNVDGSIYKIGIDYQDNETLRDRETVDSTVIDENIIVYLDPAFTIPGDSVIEVVIEACTPGNVFGGTDPDVGNETNSTGENQGALRTSMTSNYHIASRSVQGMYVGILYPVPIDGLTTIITIDLENNPTVESMRNGTILGVASCETKETENQPYMWYRSAEPDRDYNTMAPISSISGMGTSTIAISIDERIAVNSGTALVPIIVKLATLPSLAETSIAYAFYRFVPYQTVGNLPSTMTVEVMKTSDMVYISNLGTGASQVIEGVPYAVPVEHIPVNDPDISSDNMFSNVDDLDFDGFSVDTGFVKLPGIISQYVGDDIILSDPNNIGDKLGRPFYQTSSQDLLFQAENMSISNPRKVFVPMIARVRSDITYPFMRGELVLLIYSKAYRARVENRTGYYTDNDIEYKPGYIEYADTSISLYRLTNKPLVRK